MNERIHFVLIGQLWYILMMVKTYLKYLKGKGEYIYIKQSIEKFKLL